MLHLQLHPSTGIYAVRAMELGNRAVGSHSDIVSS